MRVPSISLSTPPRVSGAVSDWRSFSARRYRPFHALAVAQGFLGALTGPAIVIPLLLALGAHPALATALAVLPIIGTMGQRAIPGLLNRTDGNLRGIVVLLATLGEPRGLLLGIIVALVALGWLPAWAAIASIALICGVLGSIGAIGYGLLGSWYQIVLADDERRLVAPRLQGISLGIGSLVLLPLALTIDALVASIGMWAYVLPLAVAGVAGVIAATVIRRLPAPGRVRVPRRAGWVQEASPGLRRLGNVLSLALLAAGLSPFLSVYAIAVLGTGPGFAIAISATSSATLVMASVIVSSHLRGGSASRALRASFVLRGIALLLGLAAHPANPLAPLVLVTVAVLLATGDALGQLSANERLFRLTTGPDVIAFQSHFVVRNIAGYTAGVLAASLVMALGGYVAFAILFVAAGSTRFAAAYRTEVSPRASVTGVHQAAGS